MSNLRELLAVVKIQSQAGNRREVAKYLRLINQNRQEYYQQATREMLQEEFADALYKTLFLELDEEEEDSIEIAELTYLCIGTLLQTDNATPEHYKRRILLLHYFCDFFTDTISKIFLNALRETNRLQARSLSIECLERMQLADLLYLEENETAFIDKDEQLIDVSNAITIEQDLSVEEKTKAELSHKILYAYLTQKYKKLRVG